MPILNYTTQIDAEKTVTEIQKKLAKAKAQAILTEYNDDGILNAISFRMVTPHGVMTFRLPANIEKIYVLLQRQGDRPKYRTMAQASRVAWRILKDWIEAQLAIVEAEQAEMVEVFLPYVQNSKGETLYQSLANGGFKQLAHAPPED